MVDDDENGDGYFVTKFISGRISVKLAVECAYRPFCWIYSFLLLSSC